jgi:hypothetical protein
MRKLAIAALCGCLSLGALAPQPAQALNDDQKKGLAALLALGLGIAVLKNSEQWDDDLYGEPFSPSPGVVCVPKPRKCYKNGHLSYRWTRRIFGV